MKQIQHSLFPDLPLRTPKSVVRRRIMPPVTRQRRVPLWLAIYLPQLPLQALKVDAGVPQATITPASGVARIHSVNTVASDAGVRPGMTLAAAWSLAPVLEVHERNTRREHDLLLRLARHAMEFTPTVCIDEQSLLLEVRGSLQLFGGRDRLLSLVREQLSQQVSEGTFAIAPTPRAALWLARAGHEVAVDTLEALPAVLGRLPLACTDMDDELQERFWGIGVRRLADVMRLPRNGLARRYGARLLRELDQAVGRTPDVRCPLPPGKDFRQRADLLHEICDVEQLLQPVQRLLDTLTERLHRNQRGTSRLQFEFTHRDRSATRLVVGFASATRDRERMYDLIEQKLESFELPAPVLSVTLSCPQTILFTGMSRALFAEQNEGGDWPRLVERLQMRLGDAVVTGIEQCADHRPERAWRRVEPGKAKESAGRAYRPHWLLETPEPIRVRHGQPDLHGPLQIVDGPERIETGWWDEADVSRDYFIARDVHGRRLWVCREVKSGRWWLHGIYA